MKREVCAQEGVFPFSLRFFSQSARGCLSRALSEKKRKEKGEVRARFPQKQTVFGNTSTNSNQKFGDEDALQEHE